MEDSERKALVAGLGRVDPAQPYGTKLFDALARLTVSVAMEAVCVRLGKLPHTVEVYLVQRSKHDTAYPDEWHCPGSVLRPSERFDDVFRRLEEKEFGGKLLSRRFVAYVDFPEEERGHFLSLVHLCSLEERPGLRGKWFPVDRLPKKTVGCHRWRIIPAAVGAFVAEVG